MRVRYHDGWVETYDLPPTFDLKLFQIDLDTAAVQGKFIGGGYKLKSGAKNVHPLFVNPHWIAEIRIIP